MALKPYEKSAGGGSTRLPGMYITKRDCPWQIHQPSYNKGRTLFRPWPTVYKDENGNLVEVPARDSEGNFGLNFFVRDQVCLGWGKDMRFTCFTDVSDESKWPQGSPLQVFYEDMNVRKKEPGIRELFDREAGFAALSRPSARGFLKGLLIENRGKKYNDNPVWGALLMMSTSMTEAFDTLITKLGENTEDTANDPFGWNAKYEVGDPVGLADGKVYEFHKESELFGPKTQGVNIEGGARAASGRDKSDIESYGARIWPDSPKLPLPVEKVAKWDMPFEDAFWYMTGEEQIELCLIPGYGRSCREQVLYTFGNRGVLPDSFLNDRKTVDMGANQPAPAQEAPAQEAPAQAKTPSSGGGGLVNLDGGDPEPSTPAAAEPPFEPDAPAQADAPPASNTADSIRDRLAAMRGGK